MLIRELAAIWVAVLLCHLQLTESQVSIREFAEPHIYKFCPLVANGDIA